MFLTRAAARPPSPPSRRAIQAARQPGRTQEPRRRPPTSAPARLQHVLRSSRHSLRPYALPTSIWCMCVGVIVRVCVCVFVVVCQQRSSCHSLRPYALPTSIWCVFCESNHFYNPPLWQLSLYGFMWCTRHARFTHRQDLPTLAANNMHISNHNGHTHTCTWNTSMPAM